MMVQTLADTFLKVVSLLQQPFFACCTAFCMMARGACQRPCPMNNFTVTAVTCILRYDHKCAIAAAGTMRDVLVVWMHRVICEGASCPSGMRW
jgi:hypothetical protein